MGLVYSKVIHGPFDFIIDDGDTTAGGTSGANSDTDNTPAYKRTGLKYDTVSISEEIEYEELEDGVEHAVKRVAVVELAYSEVDETDINAICGYGGGNKNHLILGFDSSSIGDVTGKMLYLVDSEENNISYFASIADSKMNVKISQSSSNVNQTVFKTDPYTSGDDYPGTGI